MNRVLLFLLLTISYCTVEAGNVSFTAKVSSTTVEVGQQFQITFTINSRGGNFTPPSFANLQLRSGPYQSRGSQNYNGVVTNTTSISYVLQAPNVGLVTVGAAKIEVDGKTYKTEPIKIEVVETSTNSANAQRGRQKQRKSNGNSLKDYVSIRASIDKKEAYVGEKVTVSYKLLSKVNLRDIDLESMPSFTGFWTHDLQSIYDNIQVKREQINGEIYEVIDLQQTLLYPQRSGELTIDPMAIKAVVQIKSRKAARTFAEQFFGTYEQKELITKSAPIVLKVKPLPRNGKPENFSGAVGSFNMSMVANKAEVKANEAVDVKIVINGTGNLPLINAPKLNFPPDFEVYDPDTKTNFKNSYNGTKGKKSFNYLVIPRHAGTFDLDPFEFSYFDLASETYKTLTADPIKIEVKKGDSEENVIYSPSRKEEVEVLNTDIRFIHVNNLSLLSPSAFFYGSPLFYSLIVFAILLAIAAYIISKKLKIRNADQIGLRKSKANKLAKKRLSTAKTFLDQGNKTSFYEEISSALFGYFADKFNISVAELSQEKIVELLGTSQDAVKIKSEVATVLEEAEMARFAPDSSINATLLYEKAADIIRKTEDLKE